MKYLLAFALLFAGGPLLADEVVFYRCTDASGALTVQNMPCPKGMQQTTKVMQAAATPPPVPAPLPVTTSPATATLPVLSAAPQPPSVAAPTPAPVVRKPLPPLFQCRTRQGESYLSETADPPGRCLSLRVTGLDGNPQTGAGEACEIVRDTCTAVAAEQHCATWKKRIDDAEAAPRTASSTQAARSLQDEHQRLQKLWNASDCAEPDQKP